MTSRTRKFVVLILVLLSAAAFALYMGAGSKEVVIEAPTAEEQAIQMESMTPEQAQAVKSVLEAVRAQAQNGGASQ